MKRESGFQMAGAALIALFLVTFNNVPLVELLRRPDYYRDVLITFGAALLILRGIRWATAWLDARIGWGTAALWRVAAQASLGWLGSVALAYGIAWLQYAWIDPEHVFGTESFGSVEFPVMVLVLFFANGLYLGLSYARWLGKTRPQAAAVVPREPRFATELLGVQGHRKINVSIDAVALLSVEDGITWLFTFQNSRYRLDEPLQHLMQRLDPDRFFRVNRQCIVQRAACYAYQPAEFGKLKLALVPPFGQEVMISQKTAPAFRKWMEPPAGRAP